MKRRLKKSGWLSYNTCAIIATMGVFYKQAVM